MFSEIIIRPPVEADSVLIGVTEGCSWNKCMFCGTYRHTQDFRIREVKEVLADIEKAKQYYGDATNVFLAGGNATCAPMDMLVTILNQLYATFPSLRHVSCYSKNHDLLKKNREELKILRDTGLSTVYMGLESGSARILREMRKGATPNAMIRASKKAMAAGLCLSLYVILGLGGQDLSEEHALGTARVLNAINPDFIRFRTLNIMPNAPLMERIQSGKFKLLAPIDLLREQRAIIANLDVHSEIRNDHISNYEYFEGKLPEDKNAILKLLDMQINDPATHFLQPKRLTHM
ncbi:MAG: radical SAM protein [Candidatus Heimdallarchaeota archaeon]